MFKNLFHIFLLSIFSKLIFYNYLSIKITHTFKFLHTLFSYQICFAIVLSTTVLQLKIFLLLPVTQNLLRTRKKDSNTFFKILKLFKKVINLYSL